MPLRLNESRGYNPRDGGSRNSRRSTLETANGMIEVDETVPVQILALHENIDPYVMEDSPDLL